MCHNYNVFSGFVVHITICKYRVVIFDTFFGAPIIIIFEPVRKAIAINSKLFIRYAKKDIYMPLGDAAIPHIYMPIHLPFLYASEIHRMLDDFVIIGNVEL